MNNDITRGYKNNYINTQKQSSANNMSPVKNNCVTENGEKLEQDNKTINEALGFLGTMGLAQINMDNPQSSIRHSVEEILSDSENIEQQVQFCDELVKKGYKLEDAIQKTDDVFKILSDKNTYKD